MKQTSIAGLTQKKQKKFDYFFDSILDMDDFEIFCNEVLNDIQYKGIIARTVKNKLEERDKIDKEDLLSFIILSDKNNGTSSFLEKIKVKLLPIAKKGEKWESVTSRRLRKKYMEKAEHLVMMVTKFAPKQRVGEAFSIDGTKAFGKEVRTAEFSDAYALSFKAPRKRKSSPLTSSLFFKELYDGKKRAVAFGTMEGKGRKGSIFSSFMLNHLNQQRYEENTLTSSLLLFEEKSAEDGLDGGNLCCGFVEGKQLTLMHVGQGMVFLITKERKVKLISSGSEIGLGMIAQRISGKRGKKIVPIYDPASFISKHDLNDGAFLLVLNEGACRALYNHNQELRQLIEDKSSSEPMDFIKFLEKRIKEGAKLRPSSLEKLDPAILLFAV